MFIEYCSTFMSLLGKQLDKMILSMLKEMCVIDIE